MTFRRDPNLIHRIKFDVTQHTDHLGSPVAGTDAVGNVAWRERYTPFGEKMLNPTALDNQASFTGHIHDAKTGLTYMQARYYDPNIGRFLSIDPVNISDNGNPNFFGRYHYAFNDPVNMIDPDGMSALAPFLRASPRVAAAGARAGVIKVSPKTMASLNVLAFASMTPAEQLSHLGNELGKQLLNENATGENVDGEGNLTTPEGKKVRNHGQQNGEEYIEGKGHTPESIDEIFGEGSESFDDGKHDNASGQDKTPTEVTVGENGDWARTNTETGEIIQVNDRGNPRQPIPERKN